MAFFGKNNRITVRKWNLTIRFWNYKHEPCDNSDVIGTILNKITVA